MPRSRMLKPGFFTDEDLADLPPLARLLFAGLWTVADRAGRLEDRPKRLKVELLPYDDCDVDDFLTRLAKGNFIIRYEAQDRRFIQVRAFLKHQNPHVREPQSTIPAPGEHSASTGPALAQAGTGRAESESESESESVSGNAADAAAEPVVDPLTAEAIELAEWWVKDVGSGNPRMPMTPSLLKHVRARVRERPLDAHEAEWQAIMDKAQQLRAIDECKWLDFRWVMKSPDHPDNVLSGKYDFKLKGKPLPEPTFERVVTP